VAAAVGDVAVLVEVGPEELRRLRGGPLEGPLRRAVLGVDLGHEAVRVVAIRLVVRDGRVAELDGTEEVAGHRDKFAVGRRVEVARVTRRFAGRVGRRRVRVDGLRHALERHRGEEEVAVGPFVRRHDRLARRGVLELDGLVHAAGREDVRRGRRDAEAEA